MGFLIDFILHIDKHVFALANAFGPWTYAILFGIVFIETGAVILPFLPGDSLLFAAGALAASTQVNFSPFIFCLLFFLGAVTGDSLNFFLARKYGYSIVRHEKLGKFVKEEYLRDAQEFYERKGASAIILGRFLPIIRTFVPFVAGLSDFPYKKFLHHSVVAALIWSIIGVGAGNLLGNIPFFQEHFSAIILVIVFVTLLPTLISVLRAIMIKKRVKKIKSNK